MNLTRQGEYLFVYVTRGPDRDLNPWCVRLPLPAHVLHFCFGVKRGLGVVTVTDEMYAAPIYVWEHTFKYIL